MAFHLGQVPLRDAAVQPIKGRKSGHREAVEETCNPSLRDSARPESRQYLEVMRGMATDMRSLRPAHRRPSRPGKRLQQFQAIRVASDLADAGKLLKQLFLGALSRSYLCEAPSPEVHKILATKKN